MTDHSKLIVVKLVHSVIWLFFNGVLVYLYYAVITNRVGLWVWIGLGCFLLEGLVLLIFRNFCPLTIMARRYSDSPRHNFDIYLPEWLAKYNKIIYTSLLGVIILVLVYRLITHQ